MKAGSAFADSIMQGFQGPDKSFMHAMTSEALPGELLACLLANAYIQGKLDKYKNL